MFSSQNWYGIQIPFSDVRFAELQFHGIGFPRELGIGIPWENLGIVIPREL